MALTSTDETDLLLPLHDASSPDGRFSAFLQRLRQRTRATHIGLLWRFGDSIPTLVHAGLDLIGEARRRGFPESVVLERFPYSQLRTGRVYALSEFIDDDPERKALRQEQLGAMGVFDERIVRLAGPDDLNAWLVIARGEPCTASDSALLSALAPHVLVALRGYVAAEQERMQLALAASSLARSGTGWIAFDREARLSAIDPAVAHRLEEATGHAPHPGERLRGLDAATDRTLLQAAAIFATRPDAPSRAVPLSIAPRIDALLVRAAPQPTAMLTRPVMLALCRLPGHRSPDRAARFAELYALPRREAELAINLADSLSIAEAADAMGLTLETARNYTKRLYSKLGVRGQGELIRLVCESGAILA